VGDLTGIAGLSETENALYAESFCLTPEDNMRLSNLCGQHSEHLAQIASKLDVSIDHRGSQFRVTGTKNAAYQASAVIKQLYSDTETQVLSPGNIQLYLQESGLESLLKEEKESGPGRPNTGRSNSGLTKLDNTNKLDGSKLDKSDTDSASLDQSQVLKLRNKTIKARGANQHNYLKKVETCDINFGIGPAGTGKTYLAVAIAVKALEAGTVQRLILARPAVEAGERLGFLPGDLAQKIDPYLRPLYDALYEMLGFDQVEKLIERNVIEVAPLAFMRGRTLNEAFVILDEAQNTTREQMKMFLTRLGFGSKAIITGDMTQTDLPSRQSSGLHQVVDILKNVNGVSFTFFDKKDVVRHAMVQRVVEAYENYEQKVGENNQ